MHDLTKLTYKLITWDDVLLSDSLIRAILIAPTFNYHELPQGKFWRTSPNMMFGGYYASDNGDCYMPF